MEEVTRCQKGKSLVPSEYIDGVYPGRMLRIWVWVTVDSPDDCVCLTVHSRLKQEKQLDRICSTTARSSTVLRQGIIIITIMCIPPLQNQLLLLLSFLFCLLSLSFSLVEWVQHRSLSSLSMHIECGWVDPRLSYWRKRRVEIVISMWTCTSISRTA